MYKIWLAGRRFGIPALAAFLMVSYPVMAQDGTVGVSTPPPPTVDDEVVLPAAEVLAKKETAEHVSQEQMYERGDTNLFEAMRWIPGIVENGGHAGTDLPGLSLRGIGGGGHGTDYMTIMQDGVPMSDLGGYGVTGRIDYSGILTGGLESIDVAKGYSSVLLGPNIMAGVLMVRTAKPQRRLELDARTRLDFDAGGFGATTSNLTVGTRLGMFYARAGVQEKYVDHWRLSDSFKPGNSAPPEEGGDPQQKGNRIFTNTNTLGANLMLGVTPLDELDIWATYAYSSRTILNGGWTPPRAGCTTGDVGWNDWGSPQVPDDYAYVLTTAFPYRNRHDVTLHGEWTLDRFNLGIHSYFNMYEERSYSPSPTGWGPSSVIWTEIENDQYTISDINTYAFGINLDGGYQINERNKIEGSVQFRQNGYDQYDGGAFGIREEPEHTEKYQTRLFRDNIWFIGAEYTANPVDPFTAVLGFGIDMMDPQKLDRWSITSTARTEEKSDLSEPSAIPQWNIGLFYDLTKQQEFHLTYAKKNRFPSFSEKESAEGGETWGGNVKPNLDLEPQQVHHFELGYKGYFLERVRVTTAVYTNYELNKIASVNLTNNPDGYTSQYQNVDENLYYGLEFGTEMFLNNYFTMGGSFAINKYKILHSEAKGEDGTDYEFMGSAPLLTANGYFSISPFADIDTGVVENIRIMPRFEYVGTRFAASDANLLTSSERKYLDDYTLLHLGIFADFGEHYYASFGIHNILDQLYYTTDWMPAAGRSCNISFGVKF